MSRLLALCAVFSILAQIVVAQSFSGLASVDPAASGIVSRDGRTEITLSLSQPVPYRVALWADPPRLVVDFRTVDLNRLAAGGPEMAGHVAALRMGRAEAGWTRLVAGLTGPVALQTAGMSVDSQDGTAQLTLTLGDSDAATFASLARLPEEQDAPTDRPDRAPLIVLDPGHGGSDTGMIRNGLSEADAMLGLARALREALRRAGATDVVLTREEDRFLPLGRRVALAQEIGADVLLSLHADPVRGTVDGGVGVYTLSSEAAPHATALLAERTERSGAGTDLSAQGDRAARVLLSLARHRTEPKSRALARDLADALSPIWPAEPGEAAAVVLKSAEVPSVLVSVGALHGAPTWTTERDATAERLAERLMVWWADRQSGEVSQ